MKIETLRRYFNAGRSRTKLYMISGNYPNEFLIAGIASNPGDEDGVLALDIGPYVSYSFNRDQTVSSAEKFRVQLGTDTQITRRKSTHRRNAKKVREGTFQNLEQYLKEAFELTE